MTLEQSSFLAGLQAGYRLGRPPEGRKPPAPSEEYMITEDDDRMITESGDYMVTEVR